MDIDAIVEIGISHDFAQEIDSKDTLSRVLQYMQELKPIEREIVTLRIWDDLSYTEIAKICDKKEDNCKKILSRALAKIGANVAIFLFFLLIL